MSDKEICCFGVGMLSEVCPNCIHFNENKPDWETVCYADEYKVIDSIYCSLSKPPYINFKALACQQHA